MKMNVVVLFISILGMNAGLALAQVPFYQDKTITVVLGGPPAGSADLRTRAVTSLCADIFPEAPTSSSNTWQREADVRPLTMFIESHARMG